MKLSRNSALTSEHQPISIIAADRLTELERHYIEQRIAEEEAAMSVLAFGESLPDMLPPV